MLINELEEQYFNTDGVSLIHDNLAEQLQNFRDNDVKVVLNTGYPAQLQHKIIKHFSMDTFIDGWISSENVPPGRPYPFMVHHLMEQFDIKSTSEVAKVGDTINDIKEGQNAGCGLVIGVLSGAGTQEELFQHSNRKYQ